MALILYVAIPDNCKDEEKSWIIRDLLCCLSGRVRLCTCFDFFSVLGFSRIRLLFVSFNLCSDHCRHVAMEISCVIPSCFWGYWSLHSVDEIFRHWEMFQDFYFFLESIFLSFGAKRTLTENSTCQRSQKQQDICRIISWKNSWIFVYLRDWWLGCSFNFVRHVNKCRNWSSAGPATCVRLVSISIALAGCNKTFLKDTDLHYHNRSISLWMEGNIMRFEWKKTWEGALKGAN